jgi:hypothetical protein
MLESRLSLEGGGYRLAKSEKEMDIHWMGRWEAKKGTRACYWSMVVGTVLFVAKRWNFTLSNMMLGCYVI